MVSFPNTNLLPPALDGAASPLLLALLLLRR